MYIRSPGEYNTENSYFMSGTAVGIELVGLGATSLYGWHINKQLGPLHAQAAAKIEAAAERLHVKSRFKSEEMYRNPKTGRYLGTKRPNFKLSPSNPLQRKINALEAKRAKNIKLGKQFGRFGAFALGAWGFSIGSSIFNSITSPIKNERIERPQVSAYADSAFFDSRAAFTQRQRALMVIHNSQMSTRAAFGNESSFMHN